MPVIQREKIRFEGETFVRVVKVSAGGQFSADLPTPVAEMFDLKTILATTKQDCIRIFDDRVKEYTIRKSSSKRVILFKVYDEISFSNGLMIAICAREYIETKTVGEAGKEFFKYESIKYEDKTLDIDLYPRNDHAITPSYRSEAKNKIDWTPERAEFLNKIATALSRIKSELYKLQDAEDMARIADTGRFLMDTESNSGSEASARKSEWDYGRQKKIRILRVHSLTTLYETRR